MQFKSRVKTIFNPNIRGTRLIPQSSQVSQASSKNQIDQSDISVNSFNIKPPQTELQAINRHNILSADGRPDFKRLSLNLMYERPQHLIKNQSFEIKNDNNKEKIQRLSSVIEPKVFGNEISQIKEFTEYNHFRPLQLNKVQSYERPQQNRTKPSKSFAAYNGLTSAVQSSGNYDHLTQSSKVQKIQQVSSPKEFNFAKSFYVKVEEKKEELKFNDNSKNIKNEVTQVRVQLNKQRQKNLNLAYQVQQMQKQKKKIEDSISFNRNINESLMKREKQLISKIKQMELTHLNALQEQKSKIQEQCNKLMTVKVELFQKQIFQLKLSLIDEKNINQQKITLIKGKFNEDFAKKNYEIEQIYQQLVAKQKEIKEKDNKINQLMPQLQRTNFQLTRQKQITKTRYQENNTLKVKIDNLIGEKDLIIQENYNIKQQITHLKNQLDKINIFKDELIQKIQGKDSIIGQLNKKKNNLLLEILELKQNSKKLNYEIQKLNENSIKQQSRIQEKNKQLSIIKEKYLQFLDKQQKQKAKQQQILKNVEQKQKQINELQEINLKLGKQSSHSYKNIQTLQQRYKDLERVNVELTMLKYKKQKQIKAYQKTIEQLKQGSARQQLRMQQKNKQLSIIKEKYLQFLDKQKKQKAEDIAQKQQVLKKFVQKQKQIHTLHQNIQKLQKRCSILERQKDQELSNLKEKIRSLEERNKQQTLILKQLQLYKSQSLQDKKRSQQHVKNHEMNLTEIKWQNQQKLEEMQRQYQSQDQRLAQLNALKEQQFSKYQESLQIFRLQYQNIINNMQIQKETLMKQNFQNKLQYLNEINHLNQNASQKQRECQELQTQKKVIEGLLKILKEERQVLQQQNKLKDIQISKYKEQMQNEKKMCNILQNKCINKQIEINSFKMKQLELERREKDIIQHELSYKQIISNQIQKIHNMFDQDDIFSQDCQDKISTPKKSDHSFEEILQNSIYNMKDKFNNKEFLSRSENFLQNSENIQSNYEESVHLEKQAMKMKIFELQFVNCALNQKIQELNEIEENQTQEIIQKIKHFQINIENNQIQKEKLLIQNQQLKNQINDIILSCQAFQTRIQWFQNNTKELQNFINQINEQMLSYKIEILNIKINNNQDDHNIKNNSEQKTTIVQSSQNIDKQNVIILDNIINLQIQSQIQDKQRQEYILKVIQEASLLVSNLNDQESSIQQVKFEEYTQVIAIQQETIQSDQQKYENQESQNQEQIISPQQQIQEKQADLELEQKKEGQQQAISAPLIDQQQIQMQHNNQLKQILTKQQETIIDQHQEYDLYLQSIGNVNEILQQESQKNAIQDLQNKECQEDQELSDQNQQFQP